MQMYLYLCCGVSDIIIVLKNKLFKESTLAKFQAIYFGHQTCFMNLTLIVMVTDSPLILFAQDVIKLKMPCGQQVHDTCICLVNNFYPFCERYIMYSVFVKMQMERGLVIKNIQPSQL